MKSGLVYTSCTTSRAVRSGKLPQSVQAVFFVFGRSVHSGEVFCSRAALADLPIDKYEQLLFIMDPRSS